MELFLRVRKGLPQHVRMQELLNDLKCNHSTMATFQHPGIPP